MRITILFVLLTVIGITSCRPSYVLFRDLNTAVLTSRCGSVEFTGNNVPQSVTSIKLSFNGRYHVYVDSLKINELKKYIIISEPTFRFNGVATTEKEFVTTPDDCLVFEFETKAKSTWVMSLEKEVCLPPSNFIMCGDKPLITDTLRIQNV